MGTIVCFDFSGRNLRFAYDINLQYVILQKKMFAVHF